MTRLYGFQDPGEQAWMVLDEERVGAYARAIRATVREGDVVLDAGSGTGVLALLAAQAGARRVYAVERTAMIAHIKEHARQNGFGDVIVPVRADLEELDASLIPEPPTVVISETLGNFAPEEDTHQLMSALAQRWGPALKYIPGHYRITLAPASLPRLTSELQHLDDVSGLRLTALRRSLEHRVINTTLAHEELLGPVVVTEPCPVTDPFPSVLTALLHVTEPSRLDGIAVGFEAELAEGITLSTGPGHARTCWRHVVFPVVPALECRPGEPIHVEIRPRLVTDRGTWAWTVRTGENTRKGDAMRSLVGDEGDLLAQLGLDVGGPPAKKPSARLDAWATILGGQADSSPEEMAARLHERDPERYPNEPAALHEVLKLLRAAGALA